MLIEKTSKVPIGDPIRFAWTSLQQFQNIPYVTQQLIDLHNIPKTHHGNARKQAEQIRYCLIQAKEYFDAAKSVSMSTRPLLIYYGIMSFALSEVLFKGTGNESLDRARGEHAHHGLDFKIEQSPNKIHPLNISSSVLKALPLVMSNGRRRGTFELWHRVAREYPLCGGVRTALRGGGVNESMGSLLSSEDKRMKLLPEDGISLFDCFCSHPGMRQILLYNEIPLGTVRAKVSLEVDEKVDEMHLELTVQPASSLDTMSRLYEKMKFKPHVFEDIQIQEFPRGCAIRIKLHEGTSDLEMPAGIQESLDELYFQTELECLNEFGILYVGMFMLGNYARYFPDLWMSEVESASPLAMAAEVFSHIAVERAPLIALSEISRRWFVVN